MIKTPRREQSNQSGLAAFVGLFPWEAKQGTKDLKDQQLSEKAAEPIKDYYI